MLGTLDSAVCPSHDVLDATDQMVKAPSEILLSIFQTDEKHLDFFNIVNPINVFINRACKIRKSYVPFRAAKNSNNVSYIIHIT